jgi:hypothetical protein
MKEYNSSEGVVFFIDILGMSALTNQEIELTNDDIKRAQKITSRSNIEDYHQYLSASILNDFRSVLNKINTSYQKVKVAQLSDAAFIWSADLIHAVESASDCMWQLINKGIFCRGGISFGEIMEPTTGKNKASIGKYIVGSAVTNAVNNEKKGKGCRIFADQDFGLFLNSCIGKYFIGHKLVQPIIIPTDYSIIDEFKWYLLPDSKYLKKYSLTRKDKMNISEKIFILISKLQHSPLFSWNSQSKEGKVHLASSIDPISETLVSLSGVEDFRRPVEYIIDNLDKNRSEKVVKNYYNAQEYIFKNIK